MWVHVRPNAWSEEDLYNHLETLKIHESIKPVISEVGKTVNLF